MVVSRSRVPWGLFGIGCLVVLALISCLGRLSLLEAASSRYASRLRHGGAGSPGISPTQFRPTSIFTAENLARTDLLPLDAGVEQMCGQHGWSHLPDRSRKRKIYDLMLVNDELDTLEVHMGEMSQVDYFVIVESPTTFSDQVKPLHIRDNLGTRFASYRHKMIVHTLNTTGQHFANAWGREHYSRNAMFSQVFPGLEGPRRAEAGDVIIVGDVDEMVRPEVLLALRNCDFPARVRLRTRFYHFSFQWLHPEKGSDWDHPDVTFFDGLDATVLPEHLRSRLTDGRYPEGSAAASTDVADVLAAGWHCSFCFGELRTIVNKVASFSHQELNSEEFRDPKRIFDSVQSGKDLFGRGDLHRVENNSDVPRFLVDNKKRFGYMLDRDATTGGFVDFAHYFGDGAGNR